MPFVRQDKRDIAATSVEDSDEFFGVPLNPNSYAARAKADPIEKTPIQVYVPMEYDADGEKIVKESVKPAPRKRQRGKLPPPRREPECPIDPTPRKPKADPVPAGQWQSVSVPTARVKNESTESVLEKVFPKKDSLKEPRRQLRQYAGTNDTHNSRCSNWKPGSTATEKDLCFTCVRSKREFESRCPNWKDCKGHRFWVKDTNSYVSLCPNCYADERKQETPPCPYHDDTPAEPGCGNFLSWDYANKCWFETCLPCKRLLDRLCVNYNRCGNHSRFNRRKKCFEDFCPECAQTVGPRRQGMTRTPQDSLRIPKDRTRDDAPINQKLSKRQEKKRVAQALKQSSLEGPQPYSVEEIARNTDMDGNIRIPVT